MRLDFVVEELLPHPVETVWRALTEAGAISDWLMRTTDFQPIVGARFRLKTQHLSAGGWIDAEVLELDPPRRCPGPGRRTARRRPPSRSS